MLIYAFHSERLGVITRLFQLHEIKFLEDVLVGVVIVVASSLRNLPTESLAPWCILLTVTQQLDKVILSLKNTTGLVVESCIN